MVAEIGVFVLFTRVFGSVPASRTLIIAALSSILRWIASPLIWPAGLGVAGFMAIQALHALSTGLILLGLQKMLAETVGEERMGAAQGITYFASNFGLAVVTLLSGPLYARFGAGGFYVMVAGRAGRPGAGACWPALSPTAPAPAVTPASHGRQGRRTRSRASSSGPSRSTKSASWASSTAGAIASDVPTMQPTMTPKPSSRGRVAQRAAPRSARPPCRA